MNAKQFVGHLFTARNVAHSTHLNTRSFSKHDALNEFYNDIIPLADQFAQCYMGRTRKLIGAIPMMPVEKAGSIIEFMVWSLDVVEKNRYDVADKDDTALQNIIDEVVAVYLNTLYKLEQLA
jgi:Family of unknown function (DUF5856)